MIYTLNEAPGSDGLGPKFFQHYWHIIGTDIVKAIQGFFNNNLLLLQLNHTIITLIPNIDNPSKPSHYRTISLCTTI